MLFWSLPVRATKASVVRMPSSSRTLGFVPISEEYLGAREEALDYLAVLLAALDDAHSDAGVEQGRAEVERYAPAAPVSLRRGHCACRSRRT